MKTTYKHIFFDLDRTLWHFDENSKKVLNAIFVNFKLNSHIKSADIFIEKYQEINEELWGKYRDDKIDKEELRWKRFADTLNYFNIDNRELANNIGDYYISSSPMQKGLFPYTIEVLDYLSKKYKLHIISNGFEEVQYIKLKESGIRNYFDQIVLSEKVGVKKPHPLIFKRAFSLTGATSQNSVMIGDDLYADIYGAQRVKMKSIYFNYYKTTHNKPIDHEINCLSELLDLL